MNSFDRRFSRKEIKIKDRKISYFFRRSQKANQLRLRVSGANTFTLIAPVETPFGLVENFILAKAGWLLEKLKYFRRFNRRSYLLVGKRRQYLKYKEAARNLALARLEYFNQFYGFKYNRVCIKNQKKRWGSCSVVGNLNFNYKIILLPKRIADYIVVHEMCHLEEMNHSWKFWRLVSRTIPEYRLLIKKIRPVN